MKLFCMIVGILLLIIVTILFIRVRVQITYSEQGFITILKIWFYKLKLPPEKKEIKVKDGLKEAEKEKQKLPHGKLSDFLDMIKLSVDIAGRAITSIRIDELIADITIASDNAFQTAMMYGASAAGYGIILPILENNFKINQKKIYIEADFEADEPTIFATAHLSIAVWQLAQLALIFAYHFSKLRKNLKTDERMEKQDGRAKSK